MTERPDGFTGLQFGMSDSLGAANIGLARWLVATANHRRFVRHARWMTDCTLDCLQEGVRFRGRVGRGEEAFLEPEANVEIHVNRQADGRIDAMCACALESECDRWLAWLHGPLPPRTDGPDQTRVPVTFWALSKHGPNPRERRIDVAAWPDIAHNYSRDLTHGLGRLLGPDFAPGVGGQLLVWHGPPGTGKTWALRALAWEWRAWCDMHYVTDPETFFAAEANYMLEVLLGQDFATDVTDEIDVEADPRADGGRWRCLILEDTGELLQADARKTTGQGLSRLLNVVDGMIGQGLRVLALLTTNEQLRSLHPAVSRPGRCAAHIEFDALGGQQAREWLRERGHEQAADRVALSDAKTIAELYELADQHAIHQHADRDAVGFR